MKRVISVLVFVFSLMALSAQDNYRNTTYNDNTNNSLSKEPVEKEDVEETTSEEILVAQEAIPLVPPYQQSKEWEKYLKLRKCGWWMLGGGLGGVLLGGCALLERVSGYNNGAAVGGTLIVAGTLATLSSVPVLICAYRYKYKAKHLKIGVSTLTTPNYQLDFTYNPALTLTYSF